MNGKGHGKGKEYYSSFGTLEFEGEYLNSQRHENGKEFYGDGKLKFEGEFLYSHKLNGKFFVNGKI